MKMNFANFRFPVHKMLKIRKCRKCDYWAFKLSCYRSGFEWIFSFLSIWFGRKNERKSDNLKFDWNMWGTGWHTINTMQIAKSKSNKIKFIYLFIILLLLCAQMKKSFLSRKLLSLTMWRAKNSLTFHQLKFNVYSRSKSLIELFMILIENYHIHSEPSWVSHVTPEKYFVAIQKSSSFHRLLSMETFSLDYVVLHILMMLIWCDG